jgi:hypothetical protein
VDLDSDDGRLRVVGEANVDVGEGILDDAGVVDKIPGTGTAGRSPDDPGER